jgi:dihydrofolate reductase
VAKVAIGVSISLDGFIAGPGDGPELPLGGRGGEHIFDWYFGDDKPYKGTMFKPKGTNRRAVAEMFDQAGVMLTGRRTYEIANGWNGTHPVNSIPIVVLTHDPPRNPPRGKSKLVFVTDGIESAVAEAKALVFSGPAAGPFHQGRLSRRWRMVHSNRNRCQQVHRTGLPVDVDTLVRF